MKKFAKIVLICIAICFLVPVIFNFISLAKDNRKIQIVSTGTKATATVVDYEYNNTLKGIDYYRLKFQFTDKNGIPHFGNTDASYQYFELVEIKTITIYYDEKFNAVEDGFQIDKTEYIFLGIFSLIDIVLWIAVIFIFIKSAINKKNNKTEIL